MGQEEGKTHSSREGLSFGQSSEQAVNGCILLSAETEKPTAPGTSFECGAEEEIPGKGVRSPGRKHRKASGWAEREAHGLGSAGPFRTKSTKKC